MAIPLVEVEKWFRETSPNQFSYLFVLFDKLTDRYLPQRIIRSSDVLTRVDIWDEVFGFRIVEIYNMDKSWEDQKRERTE